MISQTTATVYVTADGKQFLVLDEALFHDIRTLLFSRGEATTFSVNDAVNRIIANRIALRDTLNSVG